MNRSTVPAGAAGGAAAGAHTGTAVPAPRGPQDAPEPRPGPPVPTPATASSGDVIPGAGPTGRPDPDRAVRAARRAAGSRTDRGGQPADESRTDQYGQYGQSVGERATLRLRETPEAKAEPKPNRGPEPEPNRGPEQEPEPEPNRRPEPEPEHGATDRGPRSAAAPLSAADEPPRYAPEWLRLREPADGAARAHDLLDPLRIRLANRPTRSGGLIVHDVGCGTGSMGRWLAPLLDGAQHWVLHDRDPYLLHFAAVAAPRSAADGSRVTVETRRADLARLTPDALTGAGLVTASALLDVLTTEEVGNLAAACAQAGCPALLTLSVAGRVDLTPVHPLDAEITEAFNAHQRREGLLGPEAVTAAADAFAAHGATVHAHPSPWRLGPDEAELTAQWLRGWVGAAVEQRPDLHERAERYLYERLAICAAGELRVVVHHTDLLALCRPAGGTP